MSSAPSFIAGFISDLIDDHIDGLDTKEERVEWLQKSLRCLSDFQEAMEELYDFYCDSVLAASDSDPLIRAVKQDMRDEPAIRWLYDYCVNELNHLK